MKSLLGILGWDRKEKQEDLTSIYLDINSLINWRCPVNGAFLKRIGFTTVEELITFESHEPRDPAQRAIVRRHAPRIPILSNTRPESATHIIERVNRVSPLFENTYIVVTLGFSLPDRAKEAFEELRKNWCDVLYEGPVSLENGLKTRGGGSGLHDTALSTAIGAHGFYRSAFHELTKAYRKVGEDCEAFQMGNPQFFHTVADAFQKTENSKFSLPRLTEGDKAELEERYKRYGKKAPDHWKYSPRSSSFRHFKSDVQANFNGERYVGLLHPHLARVFLEALKAYEPFNKPGLADIDPESFYCLTCEPLKT